jgi:hypothetical protein
MPGITTKLKNKPSFLLIKMAEQYKPGPPRSGVSMGTLWKNADDNSKTPNYQIQERTLRVYNQGLERTANQGTIRQGETYRLRSLGIQQDPYMKETGTPQQFSQYIFGRKEDTPYRNAA